jgi:hypothetical protein
MITSFLLLGLAFWGGKARDGAVPGAIPGWEKTSYSAHHTPEDLHKYMNGGAAKYLAYSIQELHVQEYSRTSDGFTAVLELYRMDSHQNAYGVFSTDRSGPHPEGGWQEGTYGAGLLQFWQGRYYVRVQAVDPSGDPEKDILELGHGVSKALKASDPEGAPSHSPIPDLAAKMPSQDLVEDSICYFHTHVSLNSIYYLSSENILNLNLETNAVSALYRIADERSSRAIAVCYPDSAAAAAAQRAFLESSCVDGSREPPGGTHSIVRDSMLVIVIEAPSSSAAERLCAGVADAIRCTGEERR